MELDENLFKSFKILDELWQKHYPDVAGMYKELCDMKKNTSDINKLEEIRIAIAFVENVMMPNGGNR